MNKQNIRAAKRQTEISPKEKYEQAYSKYVQGQFTYDTHCLLQNLKQKGLTQFHMSKVPLYQLLVEICKILMFNQLELLFFGATLTQMKWQITDQGLSDYIDSVTNIPPKILQNPANKKMWLSLLLIGYTVKKYLNQQLSMFEYKIRQIFRVSFDKMYQQWVSKWQMHFRFSPKSMNNMFKQMNVIERQQKQQIVNYNERVEQLFNNSEDDHKITQPNKEEEDISEVIQEISQDIQVPSSNFPRGFSNRSIDRRPSNSDMFNLIRQPSNFGLLPVRINRNISQDTQK